MGGPNVYSKTESGLLVPDQAAGDEKAIARLLREYDADLRLVPQAGGYRVYRYAGSNRPSEFILYWGDNQGNPYPLSSRILDEVRKLDRNSRTPYLSVDALDEQRKAKQEKDIDDATKDLSDDWKSIHGRIPHMAGMRGKTR